MQGDVAQRHSGLHVSRATGGHRGHCAERYLRPGAGAVRTVHGQARLRSRLAGGTDGDAGARRPGQHHARWRRTWTRRWSASYCAASSPIRASGRLPRMAIAAALPGGDPLAAALAAGETPSPELVAAAGETEGMKPRHADRAAGGGAGGDGADRHFRRAVFPYREGADGRSPGRPGGERAPSAARPGLRRQARATRPGDWNTTTNTSEYLNQPPGPGRRALEEPGAGPTAADRVLVPGEPGSPCWRLTGTNTAVNEWDPPLTRSGMLRIFTDAQGRLEKLEAVPRQLDTNSAAPPHFDWAALFQAAGLDMARFQAATPQWSPLAPFDARGAWTGNDPQNGTPLRVEAAAWRGLPVFFQVVGPWSAPVRGQFLARGRATAACLPEVRGAGGCGGVCLAQREDRQG